MTHQITVFKTTQYLIFKLLLLKYCQIVQVDTRTGLLGNFSGRVPFVGMVKQGVWGQITDYNPGTQL